MEQEFPLDSQPTVPQVSALLDESRILLGLQCQDPEDLISAAVARLPHAARLGKAQIVEKVLQREALAKSYLGKGFFLPHVRLENFPPSAPSSASRAVEPVEPQRKYNTKYKKPKLSSAGLLFFRVHLTVRRDILSTLTRCTSNSFVQNSGGSTALRAVTLRTTGLQLLLQIRHDPSDALLHQLFDELP